jgi:hypothetical protein
MGDGSEIPISARTARVAGDKVKSLNEGMKNPFGQCAFCGRDPAS